MTLSILLINPIRYQLSISGVSATTGYNGIAMIPPGFLRLCFPKK